MMKLNQEKGRTLVEMLGVLAVIGVITVGALSALSYGMLSFRAEALHTAIENAASGTADIYSWSRAYPKVSEASQMARRIVDNKVCDSCTAQSDGAHVDTAWGSFVIRPKEDSYFEIVIDKVPQKVCDYLSDAKWQFAIPPSNFNCGNLTDGYVTGITFQVD